VISAFKRKALGHVPCDDSGGSSSSSSSTSTTTNSVDKRQVVDNGAVGVSSDSSTVNVTYMQTDYGSIANALNLAKSSSDTVYKGLVEVLGLAKDSVSLSQKTLTSAGQAVQSAYQNASDSQSGVRSIALAGLVVVAVVAARSFGKN
jgi:hypothetical protein